MKRKKHINLLGIILVGVILILTACKSAKELTDYVEITFEGMDSQGVANYSVNYPKLYKEVLNYDINSGKPNSKLRGKVAELENSYTINLDQTDKLSNGDKVKVDVVVDKDKTKLIKSGSKTVEVTGLKEAKVLTSKEVEEKLVINFNGISGRGKATVDNVLESPLGNLMFSVENDGQLKNGDKPKITLSEEAENQLLANGYVLEKDFNPIFEVKGLDKTAEKATDIANIEDITRMIDEEVNRKYKSDKNTDKSYSRRYEIKEEKLMYRQFEKESQEESYYGDKNSGNLIKIFTVKKFSGGAEGKLEDTNTVVIGYTGIILDDKNEANVANLKELREVKDETYSTESVVKLYEGYGYTEVEK